MRSVRLMVVVTLAACRGSSSFTSDGAVDGVSDAAIDVAIDAMPVGHPTGIGGPPIGECTDEWCWVLPLPQGRALTGVWGATTSDVWTITDDGTLLHYDGVTWTRYGAMSQFFPAELFWGTASNDIWLSGDWHWDGTTWTSHAGSRGTLGGFASTAWTVAADASYEWTGTSWTSHAGPGFTPLADTAGGGVDVVGA